jgi:hypothetical protein
MTRIAFWLAAAGILALTALVELVGAIAHAGAVLLVGRDP